MDRELNHVWELGATFKPNMRLGRDFHLGDIIDDYDAIYVGIGCYKPNELGIEGEDANGTVNALENLYNSTRGIPVPRLKGARVVVIGGGFTAIDCTRTSVRQGAAEVTLVYRRDLKDMPAADEVHEAIEEGARVIFQAAPTRIVTDDSNTVTGVEFQRMKLGEPDEQGRRRPEPMPGTEFIVECDTVLGAIGQGPELSWIESEPEEIRSRLEVSRRGTLEAEEHIFRTNVPKIFASGDVRTGAATVVEAIGEARRASYAMDYWLRGHDLDDPQVRRIVTEPQPNFLTIVPFTDDVKEPKAIMGKEGPEARRTNFDEYEHGYTGDQAMAEAGRCLQCTCEAIGHCDLREAAIEYETTLNMAIDERSIQDNPYVGVNHGYGRDETHSFILRDYSRCIDCGRCAQVCKEIVGAGCYDFIGKGFDSLVTTADFVSPQRDAVRLLRPMRRDLPGRRAHAAPPHPRDLPARRVALHLLRHLRRCLPVRRPALRPRVRVQRVPARPADARHPRDVRPGATHSLINGAEEVIVGEHDLPLEEYHRAGREIINGNPEVYKSLYSRRDDVTLANPFGPPARGWSEVSATLDRAAAHYQDGEVVGFDNVSTVVTAELAYTLEVERYRARVGGAEERAPVSVRVTSVFRREGGDWKVVHRHADPITSPRTAESVLGDAS